MHHLPETLLQSVELLLARPVQHLQRTVCSVTLRRKSGLRNEPATLRKTKKRIKAF